MASNPNLVIEIVPSERTLLEIKLEIYKTSLKSLYSITVESDNNYVEKLKLEIKELILKTQLEVNTLEKELEKLKDNNLHKIQKIVNNPKSQTDT